MTSEAHRLTLREYLRLQGMRGAKPPRDDEYDALILQVWEFFALRVRAEEYFRQHPFVAKSEHGALPLPWREIKEAIERSGPPETTLTLVAKRYYATIDELAGNIRKVLSRERRKVSIGRVQQVDSHCLRWLTRQPGYSPIEKAGARQEILGVVRRENHDTLENRVLKDFLQRCLSLSSVYLRKHADAWPNHDTIVAVNRLKTLCIGVLALPEFDGVKAISELPQPNYVLQQDRIYSKIWTEYLKILREEDVAERLWDRRNEVADTYRRINDGVALHCSPRAKYDTPLWFNELDGIKPLLEAPIWRNELFASEVVEPTIMRSSAIAIDLTHPWNGRDTLICPANHPNARSFIQNPHRPSLEQGKVLRLEQILENRDEEHLADYFSHLHGILGGKRWIVLVPDHWEANWLERVIGARPSALGPRNNFFLLWRSVAAALECAGTADYKVGDELVIADGYSSRKYNGVLIRFWNDGSGRAVPQRASTRLHGGTAGNAETRFCLKCDVGDHSPLRNLANGRKICRIGRLRTEDDITPNGAQRFLKVEEHGQAPYFDELDALSLVATNREEEVFFTALVEHAECWPGGRKYEGKRLSPGHLTAGSRSLRLYLAEGSTSNNGKLSEKVIEFDVSAQRDEDVFCQAEIIPGQGLAAVHVSAAFLERPLLLDLQTMTPSEMTLVRIERELKRHFPPTMPYVEACPELWAQVKGSVNGFLAANLPLDTGLFAMAQSYWGKVDPFAKPSSGIRRYGVERYFDAATMSPIDLLKRENVFGNNPGNRIPDSSKAQSFLRLFTKLAAAVRTNPKMLRLLAWTYQYDNAEYESIREELFGKYAKGDSLNEVETSFCCNNFPDKDTRMGGMLRIALTHIAKGDYRESELRLAYNLMQFHPSAIESCGTSLCEKTFVSLVKGYNCYPFFSQKYSLFPCWNGATATKMAGYFIKCMLFLLHRRRYDGNFLLKPSEWTRSPDDSSKWLPTGFLNEKLPANTLTLASHEAMRQSLIEYVNGRGSLEGIPGN